jgi:hypothetical protein
MPSVSSAQHSNAMPTTERAHRAAREAVAGVAGRSLIGLNQKR